MAMVRVDYPTRALLNAVVMFIGLIGLALSMRFSFATAVLSIVLVGFTSSFGERYFTFFVDSVKRSQFCCSNGKFDIVLFEELFGFSYRCIL